MKVTVTIEVPDSLANLLTSTKLVRIIKEAVEASVNHPDLTVTKTTKEN